VPSSLFPLSPPLSPFPLFFLTMTEHKESSPHTFRLLLSLYTVLVLIPPPLAVLLFRIPAIASSTHLLRWISSAMVLVSAVASIRLSLLIHAEGTAERERATAVEQERTKPRSEVLLLSGLPSLSVLPDSTLPTTLPSSWLQIMCLLDALAGGVLASVAFVHLMPDLVATAGAAEVTLPLLLVGFVVLLSRLAVGSASSSAYRSAPPINSETRPDADEAAVLIDNGGEGAPSPVSLTSVLTSIAGLSVHSFLTGLAIGAQTSNMSVFQSTLLAILLHKPLAAISLASLSCMTDGGGGGVLRTAFLFVFAFSTSSGILASAVLELSSVPDSVRESILGVATGTIVALSLHLLDDLGAGVVTPNRARLAALVGFLAVSAVAFLE